MHTPDLAGRERPPEHTDLWDQARRAWLAMVADACENARQDGGHPVRAEPAAVAANQTVHGRRAQGAARRVVHPPPAVEAALLPIDGSLAWSSGLFR